MNLLEKGRPEEEDFPMDDRDIRDDVDGKETGIQTDKKTILIVDDENMHRQMGYLITCSRYTQN